MLAYNPYHVKRQRISFLYQSGRVSIGSGRVGENVSWSGFLNMMCNYINKQSLQTFLKKMFHVKHSKKEIKIKASNIQNNAFILMFNMLLYMYLLIKTMIGKYDVKNR